MVGSHEAASGYLVENDGGCFAIDLGSGAFGVLQRHTDPACVDVVLTHLHGDHCLDLPGMIIWRRYHPRTPASCRARLYGPAGTDVRIGRLCADSGDAVDDISDTFDIRRLRDGGTFQLAGVDITPAAMVHPVEAYGFRLTSGGKTVCYTGDTAWHEGLVDFAAGADYLLAEASWCADREGVPEVMHMSGYDAGRLAREAGVGTLVLVHIPPYGNPEGALAAAREEFDGEVILGRSGMTFGD